MSTFCANPITLKSSNPQQNPEISLKSAKSTRIENDKNKQDKNKQDKNKQDKKVQVTNVKTQTDIISPAALNFPIPRMPRKVIMRSGVHDYRLIFQIVGFLLYFEVVSFFSPSRKMFRSS